MNCLVYHDPEQPGRRYLAWSSPSSAIDVVLCDACAKRWVWFGNFEMQVLTPAGDEEAREGSSLASSPAAATAADEPAVLAR